MAGEATQPREAVLDRLLDEVRRAGSLSRTRAAKLYPSTNGHTRSTFARSSSEIAGTDRHIRSLTLALPASTGDLFYFSKLGLKNVCIWSDKIVKIPNPAALQPKLNHDILVVGSPSVNLVARDVNSGACFRFLVDPSLRKRRNKSKTIWRKSATTRARLEAYVTPSTDEERRRA